MFRGGQLSTGRHKLSEKSEYVMADFQFSGNLSVAERKVQYNLNDSLKQLGISSVC